MPRFGEIRESTRTPEHRFEVWDGMFWAPFDTRTEAEEYLARLEAAVAEDRQPVEPEPVRRPILQVSNEFMRDFEAYHGQPDPRQGERVAPGPFANQIEANLQLDTGIHVEGQGYLRVDASGIVYPRRPTHPPNPEIGTVYFNEADHSLYVYTRDGWQQQTPSLQHNLETAQGEHLDRIASLMGVRREHNWPHGIGRAIESDRDLRERILTVIQAHLPPGVTPVHLEMSRDGSYVNVSAEVRLQEPLRYITIDLNTGKEANQFVIEEESRWDQISEELFTTKSSGNDTEKE